MMTIVMREQQNVLFAGLNSRELEKTIHKNLAKIMWN